MIAASRADPRHRAAHVALALGVLDVDFAIDLLAWTFTARFATGFAAE